MKWQTAAMPATLARVGLIGVALFVAGAVWSLLRPSPSARTLPLIGPRDASLNTDSGMPPMFREHSTLGDGQDTHNEIKPIFLDQPQTIFELKLSGSPSKWPVLIDQYLDEAAIRLIGLGEQDIRFERPGVRQGVGSLSFNGYLGERWMLYVHLVTMDTSGQARPNAPLVFWMTEPVEYQSHFKQPAPADFERLWLKIQDQIRLPLLDAASDLSEIEIVFPPLQRPHPGSLPNAASSNEK